MVVGIFTCVFVSGAKKRRSDMKTSFVKITLLFLLLFLFVGLTFLVQAQTEKPERKTDASDTAEVEEGKFPFEVQEINISEGKIYIRTKDGKKIILGGEESAQEIKVDEGRIRIGDVEIDLKGLEGIEASEALEALLGLEAIDELSRIRPPKVPVLPRAYTTSEDIVKFGRDIVVAEDEKIDGDVVAVGGSIEIKGTVTGDVVAIGGDVDIFPTGIVEGDAVSVGGDVTKRGEAVIQGEKVSVAFFRGPFFRFPPMSPHFRFPFMFTPFRPPAWSLFLRIMRIAFILFLGIVVISVFPKHVDKIKEKTKQEFLKSGLVGLASQILALPIFILLIITIIGIPVALLVEPLLILAALILGFTGVCLFIGEKLQEHTSLRSETKIMILVIGILAVEVVPLAARAMRIFGDIFSPFAWILTFLGMLIVYVVITVGFGAAILTRLGTRPKEMKPAPVAVNATKTDSNEKPAS
jgi:hypothetical protein